MDKGKIKWEVTIKAILPYNKKVLENLKKIETQIEDDNIYSSINKDNIVLKTVFEHELNTMYMVNDAVEGIKSVKKWFSHNIDDRDWDHVFIINSLKFKILNTANYIRRTQRHLNWVNDVKYMDICVRMMNKIWPSEEISYESEYTLYYKSKYRFEPYKEGLKEMVIENISENFDEYFANNRRTHQLAIDYMQKNNIKSSDKNKKYSEAMFISKLKHEKAKKLLFKIISERIENWWD
jgi:hypothetical protein